MWWAYDAINNLNPLRATSALGHGLTIVHVETVLHLEPERWLNRWLSAHLLIGRWFGDYYDVAHFTVTVAVLVWVWWAYPASYRLLRNTLLGINAIGFVIFWAFPVAPPRMLSGFVDVVAVAHSVGSLSGGALASQANEYAAMPSLHVAWALWCAFAVWTVCRDRRSRGLAAGYALMTSVVVMATANHYFLDVVGGAATTTAAAVVARRRVTYTRLRPLGSATIKR
ncbi:MAG: hypothetical protein NVSMB4_18370 [Acidimicrobiales bacterium]